LAQAQRKLAAIVVMDIVGYARLMEADEAGTLARLMAQRSDLIEPSAARHGGRIVKTTGDGLLLEFASAVGALQCAIGLLADTASANADLPADQRIVFRIGLHLGDILVEDGDIYGDGVNLAARLEALAAPGSVYFSQPVHDAIQGRIDVKAVALGEHRLKNITRPVRIWSAGGGADAFLPLPPDRPSIAVLPFANLSGDPEREYFADGMVEDIITALSRFQSLLVIARNSSFVYKGRAIDVRQVARELGVRYALEGSVRQAGDRLRVTAQLVDCESGAHLWSDRFDGSIDDVFELQDQVAARAAASIAPKLDRAEFERARRTPVENLDAYDRFLRAQATFHKLTRESCEETQRLCYQALELAPDYAAPAALGASCHGLRKIQFWSTDLAADAAEVRRLATHVAQVAGDDALALSRAGQALAWVSGDVAAGAALVDRGLALNPNVATGWWARGSVSLYLGELERSAEEFHRCLRLNPIDPSSYQVQSSLAMVQASLGRHAEARDFIGRALASQPNSVQVVGVAAVVYARAGDLEQARRFVAHLTKIAPALRLAILPALLPFRQQEVDRFVESLRIAGLPE
jgi:adenylate cyclase